MKNEFQPISGPIKDLAWSPDNQRMVVVGEGREKYGHVFLADTGTSNGDISGQSRPINSCDFRPSRPFRIITGSEDNTAAVYEGPPFKFKTTKSEHSRYCQVVRYAPDASTWASGGFDGKVFLYEGKDSEYLDEIKDGDSAHSGGVYGLSFTPNSKQILTASGDKTCKLWDVETRKLVTTFKMGDDVLDQQLGCLCVGSHMISVALSGNINYLDANTGQISKVIQGHNKPITAVSKGDDDKTIFTGDSEGRVVSWETQRGEATEMKGTNAPKSQINTMAWKDQDKTLQVASMDDSLRTVVDNKAFNDFSLKFNSQPRGMAVDGTKTFVVTVNSVIVLQNGEVVSEKKVDYEPACLAVSGYKGHVAVGDGANNGQNIYVYDIQSLDEVKVIKLSGQVTSLAYSPNSDLLASTDSNRKVTVFAADNNYEKAHNREWGFHTAKVTCVAWAPNGRVLASGGLDCSIILWSMDMPQKHHILQSAHVQSQITGIKWMDGQTVASTGQDGNLKIWNVTWTPE